MTKWINNNKSKFAGYMPPDIILLLIQDSQKNSYWWETPFSCDQCQQSFLESSNLKKYRRTQCYKEEPLFLFSALCSKSFSVQTSCYVIGQPKSSVFLKTRQSEIQLGAALTFWTSLSNHHVKSQNSQSQESLKIMKWGTIRSRNRGIDLLHQNIIQYIFKCESKEDQTRNSRTFWSFGETPAPRQCQSVVYS